MLWTVEKSPPLRGRLRAEASKNSVLPLLAASLLTDQPVVLTRVPKLADTLVMLELLRALGVEVEWEGEGVRLCARYLNGGEIAPALTRELRASILAAGPLLARTGYVRTAYPGGCAIGRRPVNMHIAGFIALGAELTQGTESLTLSARSLRPGEVTLEYPSVGGTENLLLAAALLPGRTCIRNAAREPEIDDLARMLSAMGAQVEGAGGETLQVEGTHLLRGCMHTPIGDRIEAGTFLYGAAMTGGDVTVEGVGPTLLTPVLEALEESGASVETGREWVRVYAAEQLRGLRLVTRPWPGFPTDMQAIACAAACVSRGETLITETVFENRFQHIPALRAMGADLETRGNTCVIRGGAPLVGGESCVTDLRAGAAMLLAGLCADGETRLEDPGRITRGYAGLDEKLRQLGARIKVQET